jgi:NAD(P)-dependent dehydrogenase (short-subunit alcohol dehydrogenase family)
MSKLQGKTALITGGNSGIGFATAKLFLKEGAQVIITGRNETSVNTAVKELGKGAFGIVSDAGKMSDLTKLFGKVKEITSQVDILFANAGVALLAPFEQMTEDVFDANLDINFKGAFFTIQKMLPIIPSGGSIILNSTILVHSGLESAVAYSASKGAVLSLNKTLAVELAPKGIRVNCISPGPINTPIYGKNGWPEEALQQFAESVQAKIPLKRFGEAADIAKGALFLASDDSSFVSGSELVIDGAKSITF